MNNSIKLIYLFKFKKKFKNIKSCFIKVIISILCWLFPPIKDTVPLKKKHTDFHLILFPSVNCSDFLQNPTNIFGEICGISSFAYAHKFVLKPYIKPTLIADLT